MKQLVSPGLLTEHNTLARLFASAAVHLPLSCKSCANVHQSKIFLTRKYGNTRNQNSALSNIMRSFWVLLSVFSSGFWFITFMILSSVLSKYAGTYMLFWYFLYSSFQLVQALPVSHYLQMEEERRFCLLKEPINLLSFHDFKHLALLTSLTTSPMLSLAHSLLHCKTFLLYLSPVSHNYSLIGTRLRTVEADSSYHRY